MFNPLLFKGEPDGHPFRGNQYTEGQGGEADGGVVHPTHGPAPAEPSLDRLKRLYDANNFSAKDRSILWHYTGNYWGAVNANLRSPPRRDSLGQAVLSRWLKPLDNAFAKASLGEPMTVYRGISGKAMTRLAGRAKQGDTVRLDRAFISTTLDPKMAARFGAHQLEIRLPKGAKAIPVGAVSRHKDELEVLVNRGSKFKILDISPTGATLEAVT